ncbi:MAG: helix-hairpin-helix domain-containing protein [Acidobacteriota bacterium]
MTTGMFLGWALVATVPAMVAGALAAAQPQAEDPGVPVFKRVCGNCHTPERIVASRRSADQWQEVIENMITRGAKGSDEELNTVFTYLMSHFGRVNVNRGEPEALSDVLGLTQADAQKIVEYRKAHGPFVDLDAVVAVPGIDVAKIKNQADALSF